MPSSTPPTPSPRRSLPLALLLLPIALLTTRALAHAPPDDTLDLHPSLRRAFPTDILGLWTLVHAEPLARCPATILHSGFTRAAQGPLRVAHTSIVQDGVACDPAANPDRARRLRFFSRNAVAQKIEKKHRSSFRVPDRLLEVLARPGPARRTRYAAEKSKEMYYIGFEAVHRVCNGSALFRRGTVAFLMRPFVDTIRIRKIPVPLVPSKKWLVMVPYKSKMCLYESPLNKFGSLEPSPTAEPDGEDEEDENGPDTAGQTPGSDSEVGLSGAMSDSGECFPSDATVRLHDGSTVPISTLSVGDRVQVGPGQYSQVFMFTHKLESVRSLFVTITVQSGQALSVTYGHYIYANDNLVMAGSVQIGDRLSMANGEMKTVTSIETGYRTGLHNPQTLHGDIVVDGFRASTYTTMVRPSLAHGLLSPLRMFYRLFSKDLSCGVLNAGSIRAAEFVNRNMLSP